MLCSFQEGKKTATSFTFTVLARVVLPAIILLFPTRLTLPIQFKSKSYSNDYSSPPAAHQIADQAEPIYLLISIIWEGDHLKQFNVDAIREFREKFLGMNVAHFISPAYFLKPKSKINATASTIKSLIGSNDEIGIYLQPWQTIVKDAKVSFRRSPTFWGNRLTNKGCAIDCGKEVPLSVYKKQEIEKIIRHSIDVFVTNGFTRPRSFQVGGWLASLPVLEAAAKNELLYDYSSISPALLKKRLADYPLLKWLDHRWQNITALIKL